MYKSKNGTYLINDTILYEDLNYLVCNVDCLKELDDRTILITGATGMIGSFIIKTLILYNNMKKSNIKIIALGRNYEKARLVFGDLLDEIQYINEDILNILEISEPIDYIIHGASITSSYDFVKKPVDTINTAVYGTNNILNLARKKSIKGLVYISSLEVYGLINSNYPDVKEMDYGYIDILNIRSSYSESKKLAECLCVSYANQYEIPIKIARLCQTFGAGVEYNDNRVYAEFARCMIENKNIVLHTTGETLRDYCYIRDAVSAIFTLLFKGNSGEAYNVANNRTSITIKDMAELVVSNFGSSEIKVVYEIDDNIITRGYNPINRIKLNTKKIEQLGWQAEVDLIEMYQRMIESMKNNLQN